MYFSSGCRDYRSFVPVNGNWDFNTDCPAVSRRRSGRLTGTDGEATRQSCVQGEACELPAQGACRREQQTLPAMVGIAAQRLGALWPPEIAIRAGTLFPGLYKPMQGYASGDEACADAQQALAFALWELRLYLNTHPEDQEACELFGGLCREAGDGSYACAFLPEAVGSSWNWTQDPWPWELAANVRACR